jgi:hypothetical protein
VVPIGEAGADGLIGGFLNQFMSTPTANARAVSGETALFAVSSARLPGLAAISRRIHHNLPSLCCHHGSVEIVRKSEHLYLHSKIGTDRCEPGAAIHTSGCGLICEAKNLPPLTIQAPFSRNHLEDVLGYLMRLATASETDVSIGFAKYPVIPIETVDHDLSAITQVDLTGFERNLEFRRELTDEFKLNKSLLS